MVNNKRPRRCGVDTAQISAIRKVQAVEFNAFLAKTARADGQFSWPGKGEGEGGEESAARQQLDMANVQATIQCLMPHY